MILTRRCAIGTVGVALLLCLDAAGSTTLSLDGLWEYCRTKTADEPGPESEWREVRVPSFLGQAGDQPCLCLWHQAVLDAGDFKTAGRRGCIWVVHAGVGVDRDQRVSPVTLQARVKLLQQIHVVAKGLQAVGDPLSDVEVELGLGQTVGAHRARVITPVAGDDADTCGNGWWQVSGWRRG